MSNRIDPQQVAAWFKAHPEIKPLRQDFVRFNRRGDKVQGCCVLSSLVYDKETQDCRLAILHGAGAVTGTEMIAAAFGLNPAYALGVANGWDGSRIFASYFDSVSGVDYRRGLEDGRIAYAATMAVVEES